MRLLNLGSINVDCAYHCDHIPTPGETVLTTSLKRGLGGKGANQSVAAARAGAQVLHFGAVGDDGDAMLARMNAFGVDVSQVLRVKAPTGHAVIFVDTSGENAIGVHPGANHAIDADYAERLLDAAEPNDWVLIQNETSGIDALALGCSARGLALAYAAAPFDLAAVTAVLPHASLLALNEIECAQLCAALALTEDDLPVDYLLVTLGSRGARLRTPEGTRSVPAFAVEPIDTTCAGDTFLGYFMAGLTQGLDYDTALQRASAASAIAVTRPGASASIPSAEDVNAFLLERC